MEVQLIDRHDDLCDALRRRLISAATAAAAGHGYCHGELTVLVTDDAEIHTINQKHLGHDYPTDVISFGYAADQNRQTLQGELVVSRQRAVDESTRRGIAADDELTLYVIHGVLHIAGLDDTDEASAAGMRAAEHQTLTTLGYTPEATQQIVGTPWHRRPACVGEGAEEGGMESQHRRDADTTKGEHRRDAYATGGDS